MSGPTVPAPDDTPLSQACRWDTGTNVLRRGDTVLAGQGTGFYGMATHRLPHDVTVVGQPLWTSIGSTPAHAARRLHRPARPPVGSC